MRAINSLPSAPSILVRGLNWLGDAIMATPALQQLREAQPNAHITLLTPDKLASLWENQPYLDAILTFSKRQTIWKTAFLLRKKHFDIGIALPNSIRSALELRLAGIPFRIGRACSWRTFLLTDAVPPRPGARSMHKLSRSEALLANSNHAPSPAKAIFPAAHHAHDYLDLISHLGGSLKPLPPKIWVTEKEIAEAQDRLGVNPADQEHPWCGLNPGAEYGPAKRWPAENFVHAAVQLHHQTGCRWVIFGGAGDMQTAREIEEKIQHDSGITTPITLNMAGKTTLRQLASALRLCRFVLTNDTGPMHLASAVGTPVIALFCSTSPEMTGPVFAQNARILRATVPCSPCFQRICPVDSRCMREITVERVVSEGLSLLKS